MSTQSKRLVNLYFISLHYAHRKQLHLSKLTCIADGALARHLPCLSGFSFRCCSVDVTKLWRIIRRHVAGMQQCAEKAPNVASTWFCYFKPVPHTLANAGRQVDLLWSETGQECSGSYPSKGPCNTWQNNFCSNPQDGASFMKEKTMSSTSQ